MQNPGLGRAPLELGLELESIFFLLFGRVSALLRELALLLSRLGSHQVAEVLAAVPSARLRKLRAQQASKSMG